MTPNAEQIKGLVRLAIPLATAIFGVTLSDATTTVISTVVATIVMAVWDTLTHTQSNAVAIVGAIAEQSGSAVKGVILKPTREGVALDKDTPSTVVVAGSTSAKVMAGSAVV